MRQTMYRRIHRLLAIPLSIGLITLTLGGPLALAQDAGTTEPTTTTASPDPSVPTSPEDSASPPAESTPTTGPTEPTGPTATTGPTQPTGTTVKTGPTGPNGAPCQTGVTYTGGYCQGYNQGTQQGTSQGTNQGTTQGVGQNSPIAAAGTTEGSLTNDTTGAGSTNGNTVDETNTTDIDITNDATATNDVDMDLATGSNTLTGNTSVGSLTTGDIQGSLTLVNALNSVFAPGSTVGLGTLSTDEHGNIVLSSGSNRAILPTNELTGADSTNTNAYSGLNAVTIRTDNTATVDNDIDIAADTGSNLIDANTTLGDVTTGSIDLAVNLINLLNLFMPDTLFTLDVWSLFGDVTGDLLMDNAETGAGSTNENDVTSTTTVTADVTNDADIENTFDIAPTTGGNTFDRNSTVGDIATGAINVDGSVTNVANAGAPMFYIVNVLGDWTGGDLGLPAGSFIINELGNLLTGADSTNTNTVDETTTVDVDVTNTATAANRIGIAANTGGNTLSRNTQLGNVKTGDVNILANVLNFLNTTGSTLSKFSLGIINIFGDWKAKPAQNTSPAMTASTSAPQVASTTTSPSPILPLLTVRDDTPSSTASVATLAASPSSASVNSSAQPTSAPAPVSSNSSVVVTPSLASSTTAVASSAPAGNQILTAAAVERQLVPTATAGTSSGLNWQLIIALGLAGLFIASWGTVEVLAARRTRS
ncbi:hypothetical protein HY374_02000 [Candidatus Berkelbacteria bacterium]|nr:hypothetical protein [Candidatus Berkelbacteria bacterium]